jgi:hypothetical protein
VMKVSVIHLFQRMGLIKHSLYKGIIVRKPSVEPVRL